MIFRASLLMLILAAPLGAADAMLALPQGATAAWLLPEGTLPARQKAVPFAVDAQEGPWMLVAPDRLLQARSGVLVRLGEEALDVLASSQGPLLVTTDQAAGGLALVGPDAQGRVFGALDAVMLAPGPGFRLAEGGARGPLVWGKNPESRQWEIYRVAPKGRRKKEFESKKKIGAVLGKGASLYVALENSLLRVDLKRRKGTHLLKLESPIESLAWVEGAGLAFAAAARVFLWDSKPLPLMDAPHAALAAQGGALYVYAPGRGGLLKISGLNLSKEHTTEEP